MNQIENLNRALAQASAEQSRAEALRAQLRDLDAQIAVLREREASLSRQRAKEQADVDALEGHGLTALFYAAIGRREEKLDQEKSEALQAAAHHDAAKMQLENAQRERESRQTELDRLGDAQARYAAAYRAKLDWMRQNDLENGPEIVRLESEKLACENCRREIAEAKAAGLSAHDLAMDVREKLYDAQNLSAWDLWGGGLITDLMKHEKLAEAQNRIYSLQKALSGFRTELADVTNIQVDLTVTVDGFLGFADYFFDGLFADWAVYDRIQDSRTVVKDLCVRVEEVLQTLEQLDEVELKKQQDLQSALDHLIKTE